MEVSVVVHKIIKYSIYSTAFFTSGGVVRDVGEVFVNQTNYQGCQFDLHFIQCRTSTDISGIINEFVQCDQNYFQYVYIPITHNWL